MNNPVIERFIESLAFIRKLGRDGAPRRPVIAAR
jgi:hypothetical protein